MAGMTPYVSYPDKQARPALEFYQSVFGGSYTATTFAEFGMQDDGIMHSEFKAADGWTLFASDVAPGMEPGVVGDNVSLAIMDADPASLDEHRRRFDALAEGGEIEMPLEKQMWGDVYGQVKDRFGVHWMFNLASGDN